MKVLIDTNVLISAILTPEGTPYYAYEKAVSYPNSGYICDQNIWEMKTIFQRKFPTKLEALERFLSLATITMHVVAVPDYESELELKVRDESDRTILRAALVAEVDVLLTGDKDFLESGIEEPLILTPTEFLKI